MPLPLNPIQYTIDSGSFTQSPPHSEFSVDTVPITHSLCGDLTYSATYDGNPISSPTDQPLGYNPTSREFIAETTDDSLHGITKTYKVKAEFANWPLATYSTVSTAEESSTIAFDDPCAGVVLNS